jgi:hypothetical protein
VFAEIRTGTAAHALNIYHGVSPNALTGNAGQVWYSPSHPYRFKITGISGRLTFEIRDANLVNNCGGWTVKIYDAGPA